MTAEAFPKSYVPSEHEPAMQRRWEDARAFHAEPDDAGDPFCILIPPPNVTAGLHLGHAFNNTLQDVLTRHHRMRGFNTLWMPGTDHAGIATQTVVEKRLLQTEGKKRTDYARDEFIAKVQAWKDEYEATILEQLKAMGCSCDFERTRFTMDAICAKAVREAFFRLFKDGLIYRGKRLVNWDPVTLTALADDEVEMREVQGSMWYLRYPLVHPSENPDDPYDCQEVTWSELARRGYPGANRRPDDENANLIVATTRPETYLGDTAVAVHPDDPRAAALRGLHVQLPLVGRVIPVIEDDYVVMPDAESSDAKAKFATGFLKVTPAHDPNDYEIGQRHGLKLINIFAPDATISDKHGWLPDDVNDARLFIGMSREEARKKVVAEFKARGLLAEVRPYSHSVGHSYRSHVPIEPYLSDQWYVRVTDDRLVGEAQRALADEQFEGEKPQRAGSSPSPATIGRSGAGVEAGDGPARTLRANGSHEGDRELHFYPARYAKTYQSWHDNLRDWCISRQLWWGHRIPVWHKRIALTEDNWADELLTWGWDSYLAGHWQSDGVEVRIVRVIDGATVDPSNDPLMPVIKESEGEYEIFICMRDEECFLKSQISDSKFEQDPDVLDTWFSSGLWPLSTMGWPDPAAFEEMDGLLEKFNPTAVLSTGRDIITLWVSRMVMFNRYFNDGKVPFRHVYIHPMIQDGHGQRMSKSLGTGVDPRDIIHSHGADALRFTLVQMATNTQDARLPVDLICPHCSETFRPKEITSPAGYHVTAPTQTCPKCRKDMVSLYGTAMGHATPTDDMPLARNSSSRFDLGRNFCNKLWNATRFALSNLTGQAATKRSAVADFDLVDKWIIARLHRTLHKVEDAIGEYLFSAYAEAMYDFIWRDFCDWYLEAIKPTVRENPAQQQVLRTVLSAALRLLHPIMPFVTETLWTHVRTCGEAGIEGIELPDHELLCRAAWPDIRCSVDDKPAHDRFERIQRLVEAVRTIRSEQGLKDRERASLRVSANVLKLIDGAEQAVQSLAGLDSIVPSTADATDTIERTIAVFHFEGMEEGVILPKKKIDLAAQRKRLADEIEALEKRIASMQGRLANKGYLEKAPANLVQETRDQLAEAENQVEAKREALVTLS